MIKNFLRYNLRNRGFFKKFLKELEDTETYSLNELQAYQNEKLKNVIKIAYENVPYYKDIFKKRRLTPSDIRSVKDLQKLPIIDKSTVKENFQHFRNTNFKGLVFKGYTSGTTGSPCVFLRDLNSINFENAAIIQQHQWADIKKEDRRICLRGDRVVSPKRTRPPFWKFNRFEKKLTMSSYHLNEKYLPTYINKIKEFSPRLLQAYPSTVYILAKCLEKNNEFLNIPIVQTSSEPLYSHWRKLIENRLHAKIFDHYGMAERVGMAIECESHNGLHIVPGYGIIEFITPSTGENNENEGAIVGTTLNNYIMPLIRYKTDDLGKKINSQCDCRYKYPRIYPIETKCENMIFTPDGRYISPSVITFCFKNVKNIEMSQLIQHPSGDITIKIVKNMHFQDKDIKGLLSKMQDMMGRKVKIKIDYVKDIERGKAANGKFQWIISERHGF